LPPPEKNMFTKNGTVTILNWDVNKRTRLKSIDYYYRKALRNRKEIKLKRNDIALAKYASDQAISGYVPTVDIFGTLAQTKRRRGDKAFTRTTGLRISWSFFDGLTNYFNKSAADARKLQARLEKGDLIALIKRDVQAALSSVKTEQKKLTAQDVVYTQAKNEFILRKEEFTNGLISKVEYKTAEQQHESSHFTWLTQSVVTAQKYYELLRACGYPQA